MRNVNDGVEDVMTMTNAMKKRDYMQVAICLTDMGLRSPMTHRSEVLTLLLEEFRPALKFTREAYNVFFPKEGSQYDNMKLMEKLNAVYPSWKEYAAQAKDVTMKHSKRFLEEVRSGEFQRKVTAVVQKLMGMMKGLLEQK